MISVLAYDLQEITKVYSAAYSQRFPNISVKSVGKFWRCSVPKQMNCHMTSLAEVII